MRTSADSPQTTRLLGVFLHVRGYLVTNWPLALAHAQGANYRGLLSLERQTLNH